MHALVANNNSKQLPIAAVIAVLVRGDEILLVSRKNPPDVGLWGFPGGKMEFGESMEQAAVRELFEETGVRGVAQHVLTALNCVRSWSPRRIATALYTGSRAVCMGCLLYTSPSPRDQRGSRMPSSA